MFTVEARSLLALLFLVKWISWYLSGANLAPCRFAHAMHLSCAWFSLVQFSAAVFPHEIRFVSSTNPGAIVSWLSSNVSSSSEKSFLYIISILY